MKSGNPGNRMLIKVENLTKTFNKELIVKNLSFNFTEDNNTAIVGANGSGKSTLLKLISGIITPNKGRITYKFDNQEIPEDKWFSHISFCSPAQELIEEFTLNEMIDFHFRFKKFDEKMSKSTFLEKAYFENHKNKKIGLFSSGMKQRLKLALAMFSESDILLLDEPTTNMDETGIEWYQNNIIKIASKRLTVIASNQKHEFEVCNQIIRIEDYKQH